MRSSISIDRHNGRSEWLTFGEFGQYWFEMSATTQGLRLREARIGRGWSVLVASCTAGVSPATLKRWEAGRGFPGIKAVRGYLDALGLTAADLEARESGLVVQRLLRAKRRRATRTLAEVSELTGISTSCLQRYELGVRVIERESAKRVGFGYQLDEAELAVVTGAKGSDVEAVFPLFLSTGLAPHAGLYSRLDGLVSGATPATTSRVLDVLHSFMIMGDHSESLAAWQMMETVVSYGSMSRQERATVLMTLALASATAKHDLEPARRLLGKFESQPGGLSLTAMAHLSRLAVLTGAPSDAWRWNSTLGEAAWSAQAMGEHFISRLQRASLSLDRSPSEESLSDLRDLYGACQVPLQTYTLGVAELAALAKMGRSADALRVSQQCTLLETAYGFGSPLAVQVRRQLGRVCM